MSNPLRDMILNDIVRPEVKSAQKTYFGIVLNYYEDSRTVDVAYNNLEAPTAEQLETAKQVPISNGAFMSFGDTPKTGDSVVISYVGGDLTNPMIISINRPMAYDYSSGKVYMQTSVSQSTGLGGILSSVASDMSSGMGELSRRFSRLFEGG